MRVQEIEVLGLWVAQTEGAKFWLQVLTELQNRGVKDIFIACVDGLKGFPEAIEAVYPRAEVQLCIVHLVRASLNYVPWKARKPVAADLQLIYRAGTVAVAEQNLAQLEGKWKAYPSVSQVWRRNWARITPFFNYPPDIRKAIYPTNSVESLNRSLRATGTWTLTTVPGPLESISMLPPNCRIRSRIPLSPTPSVPEVSISCRFSGAMPLPLSATSTRTKPLSRAILTLAVRLPE